MKTFAHSFILLSALFLGANAPALAAGKMPTHPTAFEGFAIIEGVPAMTRRGEPQEPYARLKNRIHFGSTYPPAFEDFAIIEEMPAMMRRGEPQAPYAKLKKRTLFGSTHPPAFADFAIIEGVPTMTRRGESHAPYTPGSSSSRPAPTRPRY